MNNYDELKISEIDKNDSETIQNVHVPQIKIEEKKQEKITVSSIILSSVKNDRLKYEPPKELPYSVPVPKNTIWCTLAVVVVIAILFIMRSLTDLAIVMPISYVISVFSAPLIIIMFFFEFNSRRNIRPFTIFSLFIIGVFVYAFIKYFCENFIVRYIYITYIETLVFPLFSVFIPFIIIHVFCKLLKLKNTPEIILVAVSFFVGFTVGNSIVLGFSSMFVKTELEFSKYPLYAIIMESGDLMNSFKQLLGQSVYLFLFMPLLYCGIAVITGTVISYNEQAKTVKKTLPKSSYLLLLLNFALLSTAALDLNMTYLNLIAKLASIAIVLLISSNMLNNCLKKELKNVS